MSKSRKVNVNKITYGHSPRKAGERKDRYGKEPIQVRWSWWHGWVVHDGNDRLYYAKKNGKTYIEAEEVE